MSVPPTSQYGSIHVPVSLEGEGTLHTSDGFHRINQQDASRLHKQLVKGLFAFAATNLAIGGAMVGFGASSGNQELILSSTPFFAFSVAGTFGLIMVNNYFQDRNREAHDSLSL
ncbi:MAG TPA: hypothetical protein VGZ69_02150 [Candidatus Rhabdochlamydia sp.]|jgi:hypothetical protein|nr:hypothetical protein [Candidatus Rhabdochlamydia sp.]